MKFSTPLFVGSLLLLSACQIQQTPGTQSSSNTSEISSASSAQSSISEYQQNLDKAFQGPGFHVSARDPEGTTSGEVDQAHVLHEPLTQLKLTFSDAVETEDLTEEHLYGFVGVGKKAPATYRYDAETKTVFMTFDPPIFPDAKYRPNQTLGITIVGESIHSVNGEQTSFLFTIHLCKEGECR